MLFSSFGSEVETGTMIELLVASGSRIALPRVEAGGVAAVAHHPGEPLRRASFGALEPVQGRVLPAGDLDVVVVPGLAFDRNGYRVGYGGGFYDRFLRLVRGDAFRVGVAFSLQVVDEVPHGSGDVALHAIVPDDEEIRCR
jgi:5-formyltetrahydrofolate cyclo-ligase